jgi:hypothetical protein
MMSAPPAAAHTDDLVFEQTGGYRVGRNAWLALNASWPFGTLQIRRGELILRCIASRYRFPSASISRLSRFQGAFSSGLRIEHSIAKYPRFIVFWSRAMPELQSRIKEAGFHVAA